MTEILTRQSTLIKAMRFPLIVMVLIIHSPGAYSSSEMEWSLEGWNIYHFFAELLSGHISAIATRCFFLFSGFLFFRYLKDGEFCMSWVLSKWKKRVFTLLIPYIFWNLLLVAAVVLKNSVFGAFSLGESPEEMSLVHQGPLFWFVTGPADYPLWYLRDLMVMTLLTPLIYCLIKYLRRASLVLLVLLYYAPLQFPFNQALFYFGIGAWLGINHKDLIPLCHKVRIPAAVAAFMLLPVATSQVGRPMHLLLFKCYIPLGIITFINICDFMTRNDVIRNKLCALSGSVFFIYAVHEIYILGWTKGLCLRLLGDSLVATWLRYFLVPVIVLGICLLLYKLLNRWSPRALAFACGGRT
ncbi:MAG: acyltransferase [Bacteroidales bacterium]|nr:acyltransferase [Bacteroidales bacterium]